MDYTTWKKERDAKAQKALLAARVQQAARASVIDEAVQGRLNRSDQLLAASRADRAKSTPAGRLTIGVDGEAVYTPEEEQVLRAMGKDPKVLAVTRKARNFTEYKRLKAEAEGVSAT
jgi:hypothetical protein